VRLQKIKQSEIEPSVHGEYGGPPIQSMPLLPACIGASGFESLTLSSMKPNIGLVGKTPLFTLVLTSDG
jgi:hypothetical protein